MWILHTYKPAEYHYQPDLQLNAKLSPYMSCLASARGLMLSG